MLCPLPQGLFPLCGRASPQQRHGTAAGHSRLQQSQRRLHRRDVGQLPAVLPWLPAAHLRRLMPQLRQALSAAGGGGHHRHIQQLPQAPDLGRDTPAGRLVHEIHAQHQPPGLLAELQGQDQPPPQAGGVHYHNDGIRLPALQKRPGHFLLRRIRRQRIGPRQIHQPEPLPRLRKITLCPLHGLAGPVARVLAQPCQAVEYGAFSHIGVSRQRHGICMLHHASPFPKDRPLYAAHLRWVRGGCGWASKNAQKPASGGLLRRRSGCRGRQCPPDTKGGSPMGCRLLTL